MAQITKKSGLLKACINFRFDVSFKAFSNYFPEDPYPSKNILILPKTLL
jgi:hypothetical protein